MREWLKNLVGMLRCKWFGKCDWDEAMFGYEWTYACKWCPRITDHPERPNKRLKSRRRDSRGLKSR